MIGFGKKLISVIFASGLLASNVFAVEPKLSGSYIFQLLISPPSGGITVPLVFQAKITPDKTGQAGKISLTRSWDPDGLMNFKDGIITYSIKNKHLFICGTLARRSLDLSSVVGNLPSATRDLDCDSDTKSKEGFDNFYADIDSNKIAHYAVVYGVLGTHMNGLSSGVVPAINGALVNQLLNGALVNQQAGVMVNFYGVLVRQ